jgi:hypothetical protein
MKSFTILRLPLVILVLGGAFLLVPQSRAQSEIAPDHFDGTDSWAAAASAKIHSPNLKSNAAPATLQAQNNKPSVVPIAAHEAVRNSTATTSKQRKPATPKSNN